MPCGCSYAPRLRSKLLGAPAAASKCASPPARRFRVFVRSARRRAKRDARRIGKFRSQTCHGGKERCGGRTAHATRGLRSDVFTSRRSLEPLHSAGGAAHASAPPRTAVQSTRDRKQAPPGRERARARQGKTPKIKAGRASARRGAKMPNPTSPKSVYPGAQEVDFQSAPRAQDIFYAISFSLHT